MSWQFQPLLPAGALSEYRVEVSWVEVEVPFAAGGITPITGHLTLDGNAASLTLTL